ncbi:MAG: nickel pincer cofactor biosynthesis protein LarB [Pseudomonadota bacterium]
MEEDRLRHLLDRVREGKTGTDEALDQLRDLPFQDLGFARVDHHRSLRRGFPEVLFGQGKTAEQLVAIAESIAGRGQSVLITRLDPAKADALKQRFPEAVYHPLSLAFTIGRPAELKGKGLILVMCAGTSDIPVAEEAAVTARSLGNEVAEVHDVGVAGIHRLLDARDLMATARVFVVVAGMEGALPSVVAGLVDKPVIAVPTSAGYGTSFGGLSALMAMLNSCASGIAVVNIDNGFGAGYMAGVINRLP